MSPAFIKFPNDTLANNLTDVLLTRGTCKLQSKRKRQSMLSCMDLYCYLFKNGERNNPQIHAMQYRDIANCLNCPVSVVPQVKSTGSIWVTRTASVCKRRYTDNCWAVMCECKLYWDSGTGWWAKGGGLKSPPISGDHLRSIQCIRAPHCPTVHTQITEFIEMGYMFVTLLLNEQVNTRCRKSCCVRCTTEELWMDYRMIYDTVRYV